MGGFELNGQVSVRHPDSGETWLVPRDKAQQAVNDGFQLESWEDYSARKSAELYDAPASAAAAGALRTLSLGTSDLAMESLQPGRVAGLKEQNPIASTVGEVAGALTPGGPVSLAGRGAARLGGTLGRVAAGAAEGATLGVSQGVSAVATGDPSAEIAEKAVTGAITGGLFSLVGVGLGALGRKVAGRAQGPAGVRMKALGKIRKDLADDLATINRIDDVAFQEARMGAQAAKARFDALKSAGAPEAQRIVVDGVQRMGPAEQAFEAANGKLMREAIRVGMPGATGARSGMPVLELEVAADRVQKALRSAQSEAFGIGGLGQVLKRLGVGGVGGGVGGVAGYGLGGFAAGGVGMLIGSAALPWAGRGLAKVLSNKSATRVIGAALGATGKGAKLTTTTLLTRDEVQALREQVADIDPAETRAAALSAYSAEGVDPGVAEQLADFQGRRALALKQMIEAKTPRAISQALTAVQDPRGVLRRMARDESTPQDPKVLSVVSPGLHRQLSEAAKVALEEDKARKIPQARRRTLKLWARDPRHARGVLASQDGWARQAAEREQQKRNIRGRVDMLPHGLQMQAMEAGGGPGLRR